MSQANFNPSSFGSTSPLPSSSPLASPSSQLAPGPTLVPGVEPCTAANPQGLGDPSHGQTLSQGPCDTCDAKKKKKDEKKDPNHKLSVTTYQAGPFTTTKTMDLTDGSSYTGVGVAMPPGVGMSQEICTVQPFGSNSAADVITGTGATLSYNGELAGPSASIGGNTSGMIGCVGVSTGVGGGWAAGGGYTW